MEIRKVIIVTSGGQSKKVVETGAETLGQLKADLDRAGIDYNGKTFFEGLSKTELTHDDSLLPRDIPRNGTTTNNLVFMLTTPQKMIKSGSMNRQEAYAYIKEHGLQKEILQEFGKNFTLCKTEDLIRFIDKYSHIEKPEAQDKVEEAVDKETAEKVNNLAVENAVRCLVDILYKNGCIDSEEADEVVSWLDEVSKDKEAPSDSPYTDNEIDKMIRESGLY